MTLMYSRRADEAIAKAEKASEYLNDRGDRLAYEVGYIREAFRTVASEAQHQSQFDQIASRIARSDLTAEEAVEFVDAISNAIRNKYPDETDALAALDYASEALGEIEVIPTAAETLAAHEEDLYRREIQRQLDDERKAA